MKTRLTPTDVQEMIASIEYLPSVSYPTLTFCVLTLVNDCVVTGQSNVIDPANYDKAMGEKAAFDNALDKIWEMEGYALKRDLYERPALAARIAHEVNRLVCLENHDSSQPSWDEAPDWQRDSAMAGVQAVFADPSTTPKQSHENWRRHKVFDGWQWGEVKDVEKKLHPCMVPYEELPLEQKAKDAFFITITRAALEG